MYIPENRKNRQITLFDFNQSCGMQLDPENEWIRLAHAIPWDKMEPRYEALFPSETGHPATPLRMALGILIIQKRKKLSDRAVLKEIQENPHLQYFLGMERFSHKPPVKPSVLVSFRKRLTADFLMEANEYILGITAGSAGIIMTKLEETTLSSIALSVLVTNLFAVDLSGIFCSIFRMIFQWKSGSIISL